MLKIAVGTGCQEEKRTETPYITLYNPWFCFFQRKKRVYPMIFSNIAPGKAHPIGTLGWSYLPLPSQHHPTPSSIFRSKSGGTEVKKHPTPNNPTIHQSSVTSKSKTKASFPYVFNVIQSTNHPPINTWWIAYRWTSKSSIRIACNIHESRGIFVKFQVEGVGKSL